MIAPLLAEHFEHATRHRETAENIDGCNQHRKYRDPLDQRHIGTDLQQGTAAPESTELLQIARVPLSEARERLIRGAITDAMTVAAILRVTSDPELHRGALEGLTDV